MMKKKVAKRLTDKEIEMHAAKAGPECKEQYEKHRQVLLLMLEDATDEGQEALAGFLFAFSAISNEIARRNGIK